MAPDRESGTPAIQSVDRAAAILSAFTVSRPRLSLAEITAVLGVSKATAHRYTMALRANRLLRYDPADSLYSLGPQVLTLAAAARAAVPIVRVAGPFMSQLVRTVDKSAVLSIWDGEGPVVVRTDDGTTLDVQVSVRVGARLSTSSSAQGKLFCAFLPSGDVPGLARELRTNPDLARELAGVRNSRLAVNASAVNGTRTLAAPVFQGTEIVATLAIVAPMSTLPDDGGSAEASALRSCAEQLSAQFGDASLLAEVETVAL